MQITPLASPLFAWVCVPVPVDGQGRRQKPCGLLTRVTLASAFGLWFSEGHRLSSLMWMGGPSEASQWWVPPWERTLTWQNRGQHTPGGEVLSVSVSDVGILLMECEMWDPQKYNSRSHYLPFRPSLQVSQQPGGGGRGGVQSGSRSLWRRHRTRAGGDARP